MVWFGNLERFVAQHGCPNTGALRLSFERIDLDADGYLNYKEWLSLCGTAPVLLLRAIPLAMCSANVLVGVGVGVLVGEGFPEGGDANKERAQNPVG